jgi:hypothetical protein
MAWLALFSPTNSTLRAQSTTFVYQGQLNNAGNPANGSYDLRFALCDGEDQTANQIGTVLTNSAVWVTNGIFVTTLDFGDVFTGTNYWLDISVRPAGGDAFVELSPRQAISSTPYALFAKSAIGITGPVPLAQLPGAVLTNGASGLTLAGAFAGNGGELTNLNAAAIAAGTINYQRLPTNVVLNLPAVTVSSLGLAKGAAISNNGAMFGPDTPGTTTSGIQEGINYFAQVTNRTSAFGGEVDLGNGEFLCTSPIWITNSQIVEFKIRGNGPYKSIIRYTGSQAVNFITISSLSNSRPGDLGGEVNSTSIYFDSFGIASSTDSATWLTMWGGCSRGVINNTLWTYWPAATNNDDWGLVFGTIAPSPNAKNLNGLFLAPNATDLVTMNNPLFSYLANGCQSMVDHTLIIGLNANFIGYSPAPAWSNQAGSATANYLSIYQAVSSFGAAITYMGGLGDNTLINPTIYKCGVGIANVGAGITGSHLTIFSGREESVGVDYISTYPSSWDGYPVNSVEWYEPMSNGNLTGKTITYTGSPQGNGSFLVTNNTPPANFHIAGYSGTANFKVVNLVTPGTVTAGAFQGSGAGLTSLNGSAITGTVNLNNANNSFAGSFNASVITQTNPTVTNQVAGALAVGGIISGNGSGITNQTVTFFTNIFSGQFYTNNSKLTLDIAIPMELASTTGAGACEVDLMSALNAGSPLVTTCSAGSPTTSAPGTNFVTLRAVIPPGGYWVVTNNMGAGNSAGPMPGATNEFSYHP